VTVGRSPEVVVVDDSRFMRGLIRDTLESGGVEVVGEAEDGREAVAVVEELRPDVVTMDVNMPRLDGIEATERIMSSTPTPILMLSAYTEDGADETFAALDAGAVDFIAKPGGEVSAAVTDLEEQLVELVQSVADANLADRGPDVDTGSATTDHEPESVEIEAETTVLIGSSTGGPDAVEQVVSALPADTDIRVLIVQHMPAAFTGRFADRLDESTELDVREAADGARVGQGEALVAAGGKHLTVSSYQNGRLRVKTVDEDRGQGVRPSVNVTFESAAETIDGPMIGVVLTGMGADGSDGVKALKRAGARVIAQDEDTSVVYGMPKRAAATGCVDEILPLGEVAGGIVGGSVDV
jgi:Chemotaxis response regulator containing a CheY-like receiver domain and a methylesterase domain